MDHEARGHVSFWGGIAAVGVSAYLFYLRYSNMSTAPWWLLPTAIALGLIGAIGVIVGIASYGAAIHHWWAERSKKKRDREDNMQAIAKEDALANAREAAERFEQLEDAQKKREILDGIWRAYDELLERQRDLATSDSVSDDEYTNRVIYAEQARNAAVAAFADWDGGSAVVKTVPYLERQVPFVRGLNHTIDLSLLLNHVEGFLRVHDSEEARKRGLFDNLTRSMTVAEAMAAPLPAVWPPGVIIKSNPAGSAVAEAVDRWMMGLPPEPMTEAEQEAQRILAERAAERETQQRADIAAVDTVMTEIDSVIADGDLLLPRVEPENYVSDAETAVTFSECVEWHARGVRVLEPWPKRQETFDRMGQGEPHLALTYVGYAAVIKIGPRLNYLKTFAGTVRVKPWFELIAERGDAIRRVASSLESQEAEDA